MTQTTSRRKIRGQVPETKLTDLGDPNLKTGAWTQPEGRPGQSHQLPLPPLLPRPGQGEDHSAGP